MSLTGRAGRRGPEEFFRDLASGPGHTAAMPYNNRSQITGPINPGDKPEAVVFTVTVVFG